MAQIGEIPFSLMRDLVDQVITVNTDEMCAAVKDIFEDTRAVSETSGALSLAGLKKYIQQTGAEGETLLCINSGANINFDALIFGNETSVLRWQEGCAAGGSVEFWSILLGGHLPLLTSQASSLIFQHLIDHPKPTAPGGFIRGDVGGDGAIDLSDAVALLLHLFSSANLDCREAGNSNADGSLDISDVIYLLTYMFSNTINH